VKQRLGVSVVVLLCLSAICRSQSSTAVVNGQVRDASGASISGATIEVFNDATHVRFSTETNDEGIYSVPNLPPGAYHIQVSKSGFKTVVHPDIVLNVQDARAIGFTLPVGPISDTVTVEGGAPLIDMESAAISTVVDRQFAENLPMNGRSFQTLIQLTPGVVTVPSNPSDGGQFSINGQRANANYWMVDGVSANIGASPTAVGGNGVGGSLGSFSAQGGTNSLVSVDAMQEFRIQTSTYAPEFGRTPGGQISIVTRSGTNQFHGTAFDYLRNDLFDAADWFADRAGLPKPQERQNDFGGTFAGPIFKDRTFFFFSYEGLRLRLPQVAVTSVPDTAARQNAVPTLQPFLNAFPLPNGSDNAATGIATFNASYSNKSTLDAYSLRVDHRLSDKLTLFGRYNYSPSELLLRGGNGGALSRVLSNSIATQTATVGTTWAVSPTIANDLRFNYSRTNANGFFNVDNFGGAVPLSSLPFPSGFNNQNGVLAFRIRSLTSSATIEEGNLQRNIQSQINLVDNLSLQYGSHSVKLGVDYRRLSPLFGPVPYFLQPVFANVSSAENGNLATGSQVKASRNGTLLFHNLGLFAQDTWRVVPRLTLTYGLRWDVDFAPTAGNGPSLVAVTGFNLSDLSQLAVAPAGTAPFETKYGNVAPRFGVAYQVSQNQGWQTVLRGGFGVFYDLATQEVGNSIFLGTYPFGAVKNVRGAFPLDPSTAAPPAITAASLAGGLSGYDPNLKLPFSLEWNVALEQALGSNQTVSASYIGSAGRRLIQTVVGPNPNFFSVHLVTNAATSDYNALQVQFQRRLSRGLQALASYTWSHSIDTASAGSSSGNLANAFVPGINTSTNRGASDFDIRDAFSAGLTYDIPVRKINSFTNAILQSWSLENVLQVRSAPPVELIDFTAPLDSTFQAFARPDIVSGQPLYLSGAQFPGGKALNGAAFQRVPVDPKTGVALRQGNLGRNALRGFGAWQWDFAVHREFPIRESLRLQFRAEMFNILNHPNFGPPDANVNIGDPFFGQATQMLGRSLDQNTGAGGFSALYQIGGPRSIQFALKLMF